MRGKLVESLPMPCRRPLRLPIALGVLVGALPPGCTRTSTLQTPGTDGASDASEPVAPRYAAHPEPLRQKTRLEMTQTGEGQFLEVELALVASVRATTAGNGLRVSWNIENVEALELAGGLAPAGGEDPRKWLEDEGRGAYLIDASGEVDTVRLRGLAENEGLMKASQGEGAGPRLLGLLPLLLPVPVLPRDPLIVGTPLRVESSDEIELAGTAFVLPTESTTTYTLTRIQETPRGRIAEIVVEKDAQGAARNEQDDTVTIVSAEDGLVLFDLDRGHAVAYEVTRTETFTAGPAVFESTTVIRSSWE